MAVKISISGPSSTGKTSIIDILATHRELDNVIFVPDLFNTVWSNLVTQGIFTAYSEIASDPEYICTYLLQVLKYYKEVLETHDSSDKIIIFDCCWVDLLAYGLVNMWAKRVIQSVQEDIIDQIIKYKDSIDYIYLTQFNKGRQSTEKYKSEYKIYRKTESRGLELSIYRMFESLKNVKTISSDPTDASLEVIADIRKLTQDLDF